MRATRISDRASSVVAALEPGAGSAAPTWQRTSGSRSIRPASSAQRVSDLNDTSTRFFVAAVHPREAEARAM
ncbi:MAG TPA: hypothetical protein PLU35_05470 [Phycisphaerales bacterium]|nr:hypothetical protein [Phycisphaerales bacterium]